MTARRDPARRFLIEWERSLRAGRIANADEL